MAFPLSLVPAVVRCFAVGSACGFAFVWFLLVLLFVVLWFVYFVVWVPICCCCCFCFLVVRWPSLPQPEVSIWHHTSGYTDLALPSLHCTGIQTYPKSHWRLCRRGGFIKSAVPAEGLAVGKVDLSVTAISALTWITRVPVSQPRYVLVSEIRLEASCHWLVKLLYTDKDQVHNECLGILCSSSPASLTSPSMTFCWSFFVCFLRKLCLPVSRDEDCVANCCLITGQKSRVHSTKSEIKT